MEPPFTAENHAGAGNYLQQKPLFNGFQRLQNGSNEEHLPFDNTSESVESYPTALRPGPSILAPDAASQARYTPPRQDVNVPKPQLHQYQPGTETDTDPEPHADDGDTTEQQYASPWCKTKRAVGILLAAFLLAGVIAGLYFANRTGAGVQRHQAAYVVSGYCAMVAIALSFWLIWLHITAYAVAAEQKLIVRIILMVPIFALQSWIALRFRHVALYFNLVRDVYESYVIYVFVSLLITKLGGLEACGAELEIREPMKHPPPLCCLRPFHPGPRFVYRVKLYTLQYIVVKPVCTIIAIVLYYYDLYHEGEILNVHDSYLWLTITVNLAVTLAFGALFYFYIVTKKQLTELGFRPTAKFAAVKLVVFVSFWQGVVISFLTKIHLIKESVEWSVDEVAVGLQDFLICIEMLLVALLHRWVFTHRPYKELLGGRRGEPALGAMGEALGPHHMVGDAYDDLRGALGLRREYKQRRAEGTLATAVSSTDPSPVESETSPRFNAYAVQP